MGYGSEFKDDVSGKSFKMNDSDVIFTFFKDKILIKENEKEKIVSYDILDFEIKVLIDTHGVLSSEMFQYTFLSISPLSFSLWGEHSKETFGIFKEI